MWRIQDVVPILAKLQVPILTEVAVLIALLSDSSPERPWKRVASPVLWCVVGLLGLMLIGLPLSLWRGASFTFVEKDFGPTLLLMLALARGIRDWRDLERFIFANLCAATIYAVDIFLFSPIIDGRIAHGLLYDANDMSVLFVATIPFSLFFLRKGVSTSKRIMGALTLGFLVFMLIRTGSRGGFLGLIAVGLYVLLGYRIFPAAKRVGVLVVTIMLLSLFGSSHYWQLMQSILHPKDDYNMTDPTGRRAVWKRGVGYMVSHPVLGVGARAFPQAEGMLSEISKRYAAENRGLKWSAAHNSFVEIGAEIGIGGLLLFLSAIITSVRLLRTVASRRSRDGPVTYDDAALALTLIGSFVGYSVAGFFVSAEYFAYVYVLFGLVLAQQAILRNRALQAAATPLARAQQPRPATIPPPSRGPAVTWYPTAGA